MEKEAKDLIGSILNSSQRLKDILCNSTVVPIIKIECDSDDDSLDSSIAGKASIKIEPNTEHDANQHRVVEDSWAGLGDVQEEPNNGYDANQHRVVENAMDWNEIVALGLAAYIRNHSRYDCSAAKKRKL